MKLISHSVQFILIVCFSSLKVIKIGGHEVRALRLSFVGELGWELHIPNDCALPVYKAVMEAGKQHNIINSGYRAIDSLSIEKGNSINQSQNKASSACVNMKVKGT